MTLSPYSTWFPSDIFRRLSDRIDVLLFLLERLAPLATAELQQKVFNIFWTYTEKETDFRGTKITSAYMRFSPCDYLSDKQMKTNSPKIHQEEISILLASIIVTAHAPERLLVAFKKTNAQLILKHLDTVEEPQAQALSTRLSRIMAQYPNRLQSNGRALSRYERRPPDNRIDKSVRRQAPQYRVNNDGPSRRRRRRISDMRACDGRCAMCGETVNVPTSHLCRQV